MNESQANGRHKNLRNRVLRASAWTIASNIASQAVRLLSSLVLSRLLFPEAFGITALAAALMAGLEMFTDVGIGPSVIRNREPSATFLDTLWTVQVARGWGLSLIAVMLAYPMAIWYGESQLVYLVPAVSLSSVIRSYAHTSQYSLNRELRLRELFYLDIGSQIVGLVVSVFAAYAMRSVWALIAGGLAAALARTLLTYQLTTEPRNRLCWDRQVLRSVRAFGHWILLTTILAYITTRGNILILGSFTDLTSLGLYSIASNIAGVMVGLSNLIGGRVLFPLYVQIGYETTPLLRRRIAKVRLAMMGAILPPLCVLACFGDWFVRLLWDTRYHGAGAMVQILSIGTFSAAFGAGPLYLARGEAWVGFVCGVVQTIVMVTAMMAGGYYYGTYGLIWGVALAQATDYPLEVWVQRRYGVWLPWVDVIALAIGAVFLALGFLARSELHF